MLNQVPPPSILTMRETQAIEDSVNALGQSLSPSAVRAYRAWVATREFRDVCLSSAENYGDMKAAIGDALTDGEVREVAFLAASIRARFSRLPNEVQGCIKSGRALSFEQLYDFIASVRIE